MTKKLLSLLVAALMVVALVPMSIFAKPETAVTPFNGQMIPKVRLSDELQLPAKKTKDEPIVTRDTEYICDGSVYSFDFESTFTDEGWWTYDRDSTSYTYDNWLQNSGFGVDESVGMISLSYYGGSAFNQDNWLISPEITIPSDGNTYYLSYWAKSQDASYLDKMQVMIATSSNAYNATAGTIVYSRWSSIKALADVPGEYTNYMIDLSSYAGMTVCFAFRHVDEDSFILCLDDVAVGKRVEVVPETSITLDNTALALNITGAAQITATVGPDDATFKTAKWTSSDPTVAAVNDVGGVMGLAAGTATITATTYHGLTATCTVTVTAGDDAFDTEMIAYGVADYDNSAYVYTWYNIDYYGALTSLYADGSNYLYVTEYDAADGLVYAYLAHLSNGSLSSMDFVSIDPENNYAVTTITTGVSSYPRWMAYDFETDIMYGGFIYNAGTDSNPDYHFDIAPIDLTSGAKGETVVDIYNETYEYNGSTYSYYFVPYYMTCAGDGWFIGADANYDALVLYILDYQGEGFTAMFLSDYDVSEMVGNISSYTQKMWYNPIDGMVYWTADFDTINMTIIDVATGIAVKSGIVGPSGATYGIGCSALYTPYTVTNTHTVTFVDGLTNETILEQEVEDGAAATAPTAPEHEGYTFTGWDPADFSIVTDDMTVTAQYQINSYTLTINYIDTDGNVVADPYTATVNYNTPYSVTSPVIEGYTANQLVVEGTMGAGNVTLAVIYTANTYTLTINYVDADGNKMASPVVQTVAYGAAYSVTSPEIDGYTPDQAVVSGTMGAGDVTVNVVYTQNAAPTILLGDANCDGNVDFSDAAAIAAYVMTGTGLSEQGILNADVNGQGGVTAADITALYNLLFA